jgi:hypothetical protein
MNRGAIKGIVAAPVLRRSGRLHGEAQRDAGKRAQDHHP